MKLKRLFDLLVSPGLQLVLGLPLLLLAWIVRRKLISPVRFRQARSGLHGQPFTMIKFRTMTDQRGPDGELLPDSRRPTPSRASSLDELPELCNVL